MRKLLKFKSGLSLEEAAEYLSYLIDEPVTSDDIAGLFSSHKLPGFLFEQNGLARLELIEDNGETLPTYSIAQDSYCGECFGFWLPCEYGTISINDLDTTVFVFVDESGNKYTMLDRDLNVVNIFDDDAKYASCVQDMSFSPIDIARIAEIANTDLKIPEGTELVRKKINSSLAKNLYSIGTSGFVKNNKVLNFDIVNSDKPSHLLTIGAMLDVILSDSRIRTQDALSGEIEQRFAAVRGLGKTTVNTVFSSAKKALRAATGDISQG